MSTFNAAAQRNSILLKVKMRKKPKSNGIFIKILSSDSHQGVYNEFHFCIFSLLLYQINSKKINK